MRDYYEIIRFFVGYNAHLKEFLNFEYKKLDLINKGKIEEITALLPSEQAFIMKTNALEEKRIKLLENSRESFETLVANSPESCRKRLDEQHGEFRGYVLKIKEINDTVNTLVNIRMKKIENQSLGTYNVSGRINTESLMAASVVKSI